MYDCDLYWTDGYHSFVNMRIFFVVFILSLRLRCISIIWPSIWLLPISIYNEIKILFPQLTTIHIEIFFQINWPSNTIKCGIYSFFLFIFLFITTVNVTEYASKLWTYACQKKKSIENTLIIKFGLVERMQNIADLWCVYNTFSLLLLLLCVCLSVRLVRFCSLLSFRADFIYFGLYDRFA